jgi:hypothetical protein
MSARPCAQRIAAVGRFVGQVEVDRLLRGSRGGLRTLVVDHRVDPQERRARLHLATKGAVTTLSIFMDSRTTTGAPAATSSPTATGVATTSAGAGERRTPPSSRETRCMTLSTSMRCTGP